MNFDNTVTVDRKQLAAKTKEIEDLRREISTLKIVIDALCQKIKRLDAEKDAAELLYEQLMPTLYAEDLTEE